MCEQGCVSSICHLQGTGSCKAVKLLKTNLQNSPSEFIKKVGSMSVVHTVGSQTESSDWAAN